MTGQQLKLGVSGPGPSGPTAYAAAAVIGEPAQGHRQLTLGNLGEGVIGGVTRVPMRGSAPRRLPPLVEERLQLLGHGGRHSTVNGVRPPKQCTFALCEQGLDRDVAMRTRGVRDAHVLRVEAAGVADTRCQVSSQLQQVPGIAPP